MTMNTRRPWRLIDWYLRLALRSPRQHRRMERIEAVDRLDALRLNVPLEHPQHDLVGREICNGEAVLLDRLYLFVHVEMGGRQRAGAPARRRPAAWTRADRTGQHGIDRIDGEIELAAAHHAADGNGMQVTAHHQWYAFAHGRYRFHEAIVLLEPAWLPIRLGLCGRELAVGPQHVRVPFA